VEIRLRTPAEAEPLAAAVWPCYQEVFGDFDDYDTWRTDLFDRHRTRAGYRLVTATDESGVVGFSWGYVGERGQYWSDLVCEVLPPELTAEWVGGHFEFVELAVRASQRGQGLGRALHDKLLESVTGHCLLSTADDRSDPAVRLYESAGWRKLGLLRPGVQVMGLVRPGQHP
jgi:ribosomal protein S18 acetylase RimI-like enzyme